MPGAHAEYIEHQGGAGRPAPALRQGQDLRRADPHQCRPGGAGAMAARSRRCPSSWLLAAPAAGDPAAAGRQLRDSRPGGHRPGPLSSIGRRAIRSCGSCGAWRVAGSLAHARADAAGQRRIPGGHAADELRGDEPGEHRPGGPSRSCAAVVEFLVASVRADGSWPIDTNLATWATTLAINALAGSGGSGAIACGDSGAACLDWLACRCQHREVHPFTTPRPGGWGWTDLSGAVPDADDTAGALLALAALRQAGRRARRTAAAIGSRRPRAGVALAARACRIATAAGPPSAAAGARCRSIAAASI